MFLFDSYIELTLTKRAEIQIRILALNFYMWKRFTGQQ